MITLTKWLRRLRTLCWTAFSILVILSAVLVGLAKLLMPYSDRYQPDLEAWLSSEFGQSVSLESFAGEWRAFGPRLTMKGLRINAHGSPTAEGVLISTAALDLKPWNFLVPGQDFYDFLVIGADLQLVRNKHGEVQVSGLGFNSGSGSMLESLQGLGELRLEDSSLDVVDEGLAVELHFSSIKARLQVDETSLAVALESRLLDTASGQLGGSAEFTGVAQLNPAGELQSASWHLALAELLWVQLNDQLPGYSLLPRQGNMQAELWGSWSEDGMFTTDGLAQLNNIWLSNGTTDLLFDQLSSQFALKGTGTDSWQLELQETRIEQGESHLHLPGVMLARDLSADTGLWLGSDYLPLQGVLPLARQALDLLEMEWPARLPGDASGSLAGLDLVLTNDGSVRLLDVDFRDLSLAQWQPLPAVAGLNGQVHLQAGSGDIRLNSPTLLIDWPEMFAEQIQFRFPDCHAELEMGEQWQLFMHDCQLFNEDLSGRGDIRIAASENRPVVDVNVDVLRLDVEKLSPYWPDGIMPTRVSGWLRKNLHSGQVGTGRLMIHGDMDHWPFSDGFGRFEAWVEVEDGVLTFLPGWPALEGVSASARFEGPGMSVSGQVDSFGGVPVESVSAVIETFGKPLLQIEFNSSEQVPGVLALLQQTPILPAKDVDLAGFDFTGSLVASGSLRIPLGSHPGELSLDGHAELDQGSFQDRESGIRIDNVAGALRFDHESMQAENLAANYRNKPAKLRLLAGGDEQWGLQATLKGNFEVAEVIPEFLTAQKGIFEQMQGISEWQATVAVPLKKVGSRAPVRLDVVSGLEGIELDLPAPLAKRDFETWPFRLIYPLTGDRRLLELSLNEEFNVAAEVSADPLAPSASPQLDRATVWLGRIPRELPAAGHLSIGGYTQRFDLDGWVEQVIEGTRSGGGLGGLQLDPFQVQAEQLVFLDREFPQTSVEVNVLDNAVRADFDSVDINGHLLFNIGVAGRNSLNAEFERLLLGKPLSSGLDTESNPAELPELHLYAQSFSYAGLEMGETRIEAYPTPGGFHFEKIEANSDSLSVRASGDWSLSDTGPRSDFDIMMTAESLGDLLQSLDISSSMQGGQTVLQFDSWWPGSPAAFALARLNGEIEFSVTRGQITNASAGTGKVLGLLSIQSLPRRLALDFRDVFDSGFGFETASGTFQMENGTATTDDVKLTSSAASISLNGSTDLVNKQYDQQMTVMPGVGNTLPVIGAIAAGPGGAAAGLALQGLLHEQLGKATQVQYSITGSWEDPVIEPIIRNEEADQTGAEDKQTDKDESSIEQGESNLPDMDSQE